MEFRRNLTVSFFVHAVILITAVISVTGRDVVTRVPFVPLYVELSVSPTVPVHHMSSTSVIPPLRKAAASLPPPSHVLPLQNAVPEVSQKAIDIEKKEIYPAPVEDGRVKNPEAAQTGKEDKEAPVRKQGFNYFDNRPISGNPAVSFTAGRAETQSPLRSLPVTVGGTEKGRADASTAIRSALERAKYYPLTARRRGIEGTVIVEFSIRDNGLPENINIAVSSGSEILDNAALATVTRASPFPHDIRNIKIPISFRLEKD